MSDARNPGTGDLGTTYPPALRPSVPIGKPNELIPLYSGPMDFTQKGNTFRADGHVFFAWLPSPAIRFEVPVLPEDVHPELDELSFRLDDGTLVDRALVTGSNHSMVMGKYSISLSGIVGQRVIRPCDTPAQRVLFLLPNFEDLHGHAICYPDGSKRASRLTLRGGGWIVTLDLVNDQKSVTKFLASQSGFGVTHIGQLEREDGNTLNAEESLTILDTLSWYLSFAAGRWTGPCLRTGVDESGKQIWQAWDYARTVPFRRRLSWLDHNHGEQLEAPFSGFTKLWLDKEWEEVVRVAIHWFVEANAQAGSIEGSIVLTQTAFELLSSAVLVEHQRWLSTDGYEKLSAADRIRLLFLWARIPVAIPAALTELTSQSKADNWPDTATAMTMIRNAITHPTKKNRERFGKQLGGARSEAWTLGLWNLELCLLRLFDYRGTYGNRVTQKYVGEVELVPWA